ncbi:MAG TPA: hypothetical protein GX013_10845 [Propionibacterium sp.]|nr:hypothetical protein [Propionibacterium sp.]
MNEGLDLVQSGIAALWESTRSIRATENPGLAGLVEGLAEVEAQIVGLRLHLIHEARLAGADDVLAGVRESVRTTTAHCLPTTTAPRASPGNSPWQRPRSWPPNWTP